MRARPSPQPPMLDSIALGPLEPGHPDDLHRGADLDAMHVDAVSVDALDLAGATISECRFTRLVAAETDLKGARLREVELDGVDLPMVRAARNQWRDVTLTGRLASLEAYESQWRGVHFVGCRLNYVNLRGAELLDVAFTDCAIDDLDLIGADLRRVRFSGTRIATLDVHDATLRDVDLRGADLETIAGLTSLRGATISPTQLTLLAPLLAETVGIRIG